jgi:hypothetical protein
LRYLQKGEEGRQVGKTKSTIERPKKKGKPKKKGLTKRASAEVHLSEHLSH